MADSEKKRPAVKFDDPMEVFINSGCVFGFFPICIKDKTLPVHSDGGQGSNLKTPSRSDEGNPHPGLKRNDESNKEFYDSIKRSAPVGWWNLSAFAKGFSDVNDLKISSTQWLEEQDNHGNPINRFCRGRFVTKTFIHTQTQKSAQAESNNVTVTKLEVFGVEIAFDTTSDGDEDKERERGFLLGPERDLGWSKKNLQQPPSVYHHYKVGESHEFRFVYGGVEFKGSVFLRQNDAVTPRLADLVVDVGNTRTIAMLVKYPGNDYADIGGTIRVEDFRNRCRPVMLSLNDRKNAVTPENFSDIGKGVVSSWFILHETEFSGPLEKVEKDNHGKYTCLCQERFVMKREEGWWTRLLKGDKVVGEFRFPTMFSQISPVVLGDAATDFLKQGGAELIKSGKVLEQTSPKRYFSDMSPKDQTGFWRMIANADNSQALPLAANILYWMNQDGHFDDRSNLLNEPKRGPAMPNYPRSSTLVWMLVKILEKAWEQCNVDPILGERQFQYKLGNVIITYPSGWTYDEIAQYRDRCYDAIKIFELSTSGKTGNIGLRMEVDEAVASQMPYVFSEIHRLGNNAEKWITLTGKRRKQQGDDSFQSSVRVMSLDIGGGTSDVSIMEYSYSGKKLRPRLIFKDGVNLAGDELVRRIIKDVLFDKTYLDMDSAGLDLLSSVDVCLKERFGSKVQRAESSLHIKKCLVPIAIAVIKELENGGGEVKIVADDTPGAVEQNAWDDFGSFLTGGTEPGPDWDKVVVKGAYKAKVEECVKELFERCMKTCAKLVVDYDVDVFFMSGKTSEIGKLKEMARDEIPLLRNRVVTARDYVVGAWYPFSDSDKHISDAKSVTAVGAAIHHMLSFGYIAGVAIDGAEMDASDSATHAWGRLEELLTDPEKNKKVEMKFELELCHNDRIGKYHPMSRNVESVYRFEQVKGRRDHDNKKKYVVKFERRVQNGSEGLVIVSVDGNENYEGFLLKVDQLNSEDWEFWQDSGQLYV